MSFKSGLLWLDDDPRKNLEEKVLRAAAHYENKYGRAPDLCYVHPSAFDDNGNGKPKKAGTVEIRAGRSVLPHHFWLGVTEERVSKKTNPANSTSAPQPSLASRVAAAEVTMTPEEARQLALALENR
jgi:hypothetical protein